MDSEAWKRELQEQAEVRLLLQELKDMNMKEMMVLLCLLLVGCTTSDAEAIKTVKKLGFTDIQTTGTVWIGCSEGDKVGRAFKAKNAQGMEIEGIVCCGNWKACTVRF